MKRILSIAFLLSAVILSYSLQAQKQKDKKQKPNEEIKVNREYDKEGNLIRYDSTYVYTWSSDTVHHFGSDSIVLNHPDMNEIQRMMREQMQRFFPQDSAGQRAFRHHFFNNDFFGGNFLDDKFFNMDFPNEEFFKEFDKMMEEHMQFRDENFEKMHQHMDSLRMELQKRFREMPHQNQTPEPKPQKQNYKTSEIKEM